jgi:hypothetical protein
MTSDSRTSLLSARKKSSKSAAASSALILPFFSIRTVQAYSRYAAGCASLAEKITDQLRESKKSRAELKEHLKEVVECMITFFYTFDFDDIKADPKPKIKSGRPACEIQMNAHVYAIADKYQIDELKDLALEKFKTPVNLDNGMALLGATWTMYKNIKIPDG